MQKVQSEAKMLGFSLKLKVKDFNTVKLNNAMTFISH